MPLRAVFLILLLAATCYAAEPKRDRHGDPLPDGALARLGTVHAQPICKTVAFSADGRAIITTGGTTVRHWDTSTGRVVAAWSRAASNVETQAISADGRTVVAVLAHRLEFHDLQRDKPIRTLPLPSHHGVDCLSLSPDADLAIVTLREVRDQSKTIVVHSGRVEQWEVLEHPVAAAKFSPDGKFVVLHCRWADQGEAQLRDAVTGRLLRHRNYRGTVVAVGPGGRALLQITWPGDDLLLFDANVAE